MNRSNHMHHFWNAFDPIASALSTFRGTALIFPSDPIAEAHTVFRRYRRGRAMVAAPNLIQHHGRGLTAKVTTLSTYDHGQNAAKRGKHLQACPFDTGSAITVECLRFIRPEIKFSSVQDLRAQIAKDVEAARADAAGQIGQ